MESIADTFARNLRRLRKERGLTQERLAHDCELSVVFLQNLEAGRRWVGPATVAALSRALEVPETEFFKPEGAQAQPSEWSHLPDDIRTALLKVCRHPNWPWDAFRLMILGFENPRSPYKVPQKPPSGPRIRV